MFHSNLTYLNASAIAACELIDLLPHSDVIEELKNLFNTSAYVSSLLLINRALPEEEACELTIYAKEIEIQALKLKMAHINTSKQ